VAEHDHFVGPYNLCSDFTLKMMLSDDAFEVHETEYDPMKPMREAVHRHHVTRVETKEKLIRDGLIALGWTPPPDPKPE
jgi:hypothetical protein